MLGRYHESWYVAKQSSNVIIIVNLFFLNSIVVGEEDGDEDAAKSEYDSTPSLMTLSGMITPCTKAGWYTFWLISQLIPTFWCYQWKHVCTSKWSSDCSRRIIFIIPTFLPEKLK